MRHAQCARLAGSALALALLAGCSNGEGPSRVPSSIAAVSGNNQSGQVGSILPAPVVLRVTDKDGGLPGVSVALAIPQGQGGVLSPASGVTDANGDFQTVWQLGSAIGSQTFTATVTGVPPATVTATVAAGPATSITPLTPTTQFVVAGRLVTVQPSVRVTDGFGNPRPGETVVFTVGNSGGAISGPTAKSTDADGRATVDGWSIGPNADFYTLTARVSTASTIFSVFGVPAQIQAAGGLDQSANSGTQVSTQPAVLALGDNGQPLANVPVNFQITQGGGSILPPTSVTGADGIARANGWILGVTPGVNRLEATVTGVGGSAVFMATGVLATPASIVATPVPSTGAFFGNFASILPAVTVTDVDGKPVAGATVTFTVTEGNGLLVGGSPQTDFLGRASTRVWRFGPSGNQTVRGTLNALPPVDFTVTPSDVPSSQFNIEVRYPGSQPTPGQQAAFDAAIARWQSVIIGDIPDVDSVNFTPAAFCPGAVAMVNESIDDVVIFADLVTIDGAGGVLGRAGPCLIRSSGRLTAMGVMQFDVADLTTLETNGRLNDVILHEMAHVLGFGTLWNELALLQNGGGSDPFFKGPSAGGAFLAAVLGGASFNGNAVPVENLGGPGTRDAHWRKAIVANELMTGSISLGNSPLSAFSLASLRDLGYVVNDAVADAFTFQPQLLGGFGGGITLREEALKGPIIVIDRRGRETARIPRM
jgi:hypothetical protein